MIRTESRTEDGGAGLGVRPFRYPPALPLARTPTPIERLDRLSEDFGVEIDVKRDDLTGLGLTGNKVRKLEFLLAAAHDSRCDSVITCGGVQSNHARATALAAVKLGMAPHLVLRADEPPRGAGGPPVPPASAEGNLFLSKLAGATIRWITRDEWPRRDEIMREEAAALLAREGRRSYVIPEGGSNALGAWGYVRCAEEVAVHEERTGASYDLVVCASGSGGTQAGLLAGRGLLGRKWRVLSFAVCDSALHFKNVVEGILCDLATHYSLHIPGAEDAFECDDSYIGAGYGVSRPEEIETIREAAATEGLLLDPTYTGKAFHGLLSEIRAGRIARGTRVLFVHTGGLFGLFPKAKEFGL
jgi:D-cysteine desulfhydrase